VPLLLFRGVGVVISLGDSLNNIRLIADVTTNNPFATALALAVADVETGADDFIVRLAANLELRPRRSCL
jgi:hypothetical protein